MKKMDAGLSAVRRAEKLEAKVESLTRALREAEKVIQSALTAGDHDAS